MSGTNRARREAERKNACQEPRRVSRGAAADRLDQFFSTTLDTLLEYLQVERLILTGLSADMCVLITAVDAHMRDFEIYAPRDCTASISPAATRAALQYMMRVPDANTTPSAKLDLRKLAARPRQGKKKRKKS